MFSHQLLLVSLMYASGMPDRSATKLSEYVLEHEIDIMAVTETWLNDESSVVIGELTPPGYFWMFLDRSSPILIKPTTMVGLAL